MAVDGNTWRRLHGHNCKLTMDAVFLIINKGYITKFLLLLSISNASWLGITENPLEDLKNSPCLVQIGFLFLVIHILLFLL